ncbi:guanosine monophosphate reductase [Candidatus Daviesbacteria bacterium]|nr:guanosine monophosphate reductase [Candidatus Daviesbacteria bacterium]
MQSLRKMGQVFPLGLSFDDVLLIPQHSGIKSRSLVDLTTQLTPSVSLKLPILSTNMTDVTGVEMAIALGKLGGMGILPRFENPKVQADMVKQVKKNEVSVAAAVGCKEGFLDRAEKLAKAGVDILLLDIAHGHMQQALDATKKIKNKFGQKIGLISGAIATYAGANDLYQAGADCVRVGVGPGSICTTRIVTGVGIPQITAITEASKAAKKWKRTILADGGIKNSGDIAKALAAGASAVSLGNVFAGTDEAPGKIVIRKGKKYKIYRGSTSIESKNDHQKKLSDLSNNYLHHIEGVEGLVPFKGPVQNLVLQFVANLKSSFSYVGAKNLRQFHRYAKFIRVTSLGLRENGPHDILTQD